MDKFYVRTFSSIELINLSCLFQIEYTLFFRQLGNYRQIVKTPKLEFCGLVKNANESGPINQMARILLSSSNGTIHECPYLPGPFRIGNYTEKNADFSFAPIFSGDFKTLIQLSSDDDDNVFKLITKTTIRNDLRGDF